MEQRIYTSVQKLRLDQLNRTCKVYCTVSERLTYRPDENRVITVVGEETFETIPIDAQFNSGVALVRQALIADCWELGLKRETKEILAQYK